MVYYRRRRPYRRRRYYRRRRGLNRTQYRAVSRIIDKKKELKYFDVAATGTGMGTGGTIVSLVDIGQGDTITTREGNKITLKSLQFKAQLQRVTTDSQVRVCLFKWFSPTPGTNPAVTDIFVTGGSLHSLVKAGTAQFKVLFDRTFNVLDSDSPTRVISMFKRLRSDVHWTNATATNWTKNQYVLYFISDNAINNPLISYQIRFRFVDA